MKPRFIPSSVIEAERKLRSVACMQALDEATVERRSDGIVVDRDHPRWRDHLRLYGEGVILPVSGASDQPPRPLPVAVPRSKWPWVVRVIARLRRPPDAGIGDTLATAAALLGGEWIKSALKDAGIDCGCDYRQAWMNAKFPYDQAEIAR